MNVHLIYGLCLLAFLVVSLIVIRAIYKDSVISFIGYSLVLFALSASIGTYIFTSFGWMNIFWIIPVITGILVLILKYIFVKIREPLNRIVDIASDLSNGILRVQTDIVQEGEIGRIAQTLTDTVSNLKEVITDVVESSDQIANAADEISRASTDLSDRTERQAVSLEETTASMSEINSSIRTTAANAEQADMLSKVANIKADQGKKDVTHLIKSMSDINESSKKIADSINVINEIAFQTNILALNASVEAARAGEYGRGFAIVASEVRSLAQKSKDASKEIASHIMISNEKVEIGSKSVEQVKGILGEITDVIKNVNKLIDAMTSAGKEQLASIEEVNQAIIGIDENTRNDATMAEEAAAASEELSAQSHQLRSSMDCFKFDD